MRRLSMLVALLAILHVNGCTSSSGQALGGCSEHITDVISITTASGEKNQIYFDITGFFGKW